MRTNAVTNATALLKIRHHQAIENRPETNGVAERCVCDVSDGTKVNLEACKFGHAYWREAQKNWCFANNVSEQDDGSPIPYEARHGKKFAGMILPFGCSVQYLPSAQHDLKLYSCLPNPEVVLSIFLAVPSG